MLDRRKAQRSKVVLPVKISLTGSSHLAHTVDITCDGARLGGLRTGRDAEEPIGGGSIAGFIDVETDAVENAISELVREYDSRNGGLQLREIAGGWQIATRPEHHENVRAYLRSKPSAKLSLASLETLAVIAYKQPITIPEILEIRGVQSPSAIKTLLDKRLIVAKGRKETVGRPMMYGTSKEFLIQFGLKDLSELPSIEDFRDLAGGES